MEFVSDTSEKSEICSRILRALPRWFGIEEAIMEYTRKFYEKCGFVPFDEFLTLWGDDNPCLYMLKEVE